jgi:hypothetical protein
MRKFLITSFLMLVSVAPALAKSIDVYPVSCDDLWAAVNVTLSNTNNYRVLSIDDAGQKARFVVVGELNPINEKVELKAKGGGCMADATITELGPGNSGWLQFHHRLAQSLAKLQAAKPKSVVTATGQQ